MPSLTQLEYLLAVDEFRNFGRAAEACYVSQPSLSVQVQKLEEELDIIVFDRSKKPVVPTVEGQKVIKQAKVVIQEAQKLLELKQAEPSGPFHLGVIPSVAPYLIPLFIESFSHEFPHVQLKISEVKTEDMLDQLYNDRLDGGILVTPIPNSKVIERSLYYEKFAVFCSEHHRLHKKKAISEKDLDPSEIWLLEEGHCLRGQVAKVCSVSGENRVLKNVNFSSGSMETLINLVRQGRGYTLVPELATLGLAANEKTHFIRNFKNPVPTREVSLAHSRTFLKSQILDALEVSIIQNLPKQIKSLKREKLNVIPVRL